MADRDEARLSERLSIRFRKHSNDKLKDDETGRKHTSGNSDSSKGSESIVAIPWHAFPGNEELPVVDY